MVESLVALIALSLMEIVLGLDNIVFISILTSKLPLDQQSLGRRLGLVFALATRLMLLAGIFWIVQLSYPVFTLTGVFPPIEGMKSHFFVEPARGDAHSFVGENASTQTDEESNLEPEADASPESLEAEAKAEAEFDEEAWSEFNGVSWRDLIMLSGGIFLIFNSVREIHTEVEGAHESQNADGVKKISFRGMLFKIAIMDIVFSLDSVITAVGMANQLWIMFTAVILAVGVMILFANQIGNFVDQNPTVKMLALNFLLLIGVMLVAEGVGTPISKGYIYFAMAFSLLVEFFNMRIRKRSDVTLAGV